MIQDDMTAARQDWIDAAKKNPAEYRWRTESDFMSIKTEKGKIDFHALRHSFGSMLAAAGVHPKTAMELMRLSKIELTMGIYTHAQDEKLTEAIDNLPDFEQRQVAVKTGTDDFSVDAIAENRGEITTPKNTPNRPAKGGINRHESAQVNVENQNCKNAVEWIMSHP